MSTDLIKKMRIGQGSSSTVKDIGVEADNVENLSAFLGISISGEEGPITRLEGAAAFNELFTNEDSTVSLLPEMFKGYLYKMGNSILGAFVEDLYVGIKPESIYNNRINDAHLSTEDFFNFSGYKNNVLSNKGGIYRNGESTGRECDMNFNYSDTKIIRFDGGNISGSSIGVSFTVKNKDSFWMIPQNKKQLSTNDFTNEYKNKIDTLEFNITQQNIDNETPNSSIIRNTSLYNFVSNTDYYRTNQYIKYKTYSISGKIIRLDILEIGLFHNPNTTDNLQITSTYGSYLYEIKLINFLSNMYEDKITNIIFYNTLFTKSGGQILTTFIGDDNSDFNDNLLSYSVSLSEQPSSSIESYCLTGGSFDEPIISFYF